MKKMNYGSFTCEISVAENYTLISEIPCEYAKDTVAYAVERFFARFKRFRKECTYESWQLRIAKGRAKKKHDFMYLVPALFMELPGNWIRISGIIDTAGVNVNRVEILKEHPCFCEPKSKKSRNAG